MNATLETIKEIIQLQELGEFDDEKALERITNQIELSKIGYSGTFIRPDILKMAVLAEETMRLHDHEKGDSYQRCSILHLDDKLEEEYHEYKDALNHYGYASGDDRKVRELLDIAVVIAMLISRLTETIEEVDTK